MARVAAAVRALQLLAKLCQVVLFGWSGVACLVSVRVVKEFQRFRLPHWRRLTGVMQILASAGLLAGPEMPREIPRGLTYCQHALGSRGFFVVSDGLSDSRMSQLASVRGPDGFRAYAGVQLIMPEGLSIGSL